jgi:hypothetical protein
MRRRRRNMRRRKRSNVEPRKGLMDGRRRKRRRSRGTGFRERNLVYVRTRRAANKVTRKEMVWTRRGKGRIGAVRMRKAQGDEHEENPTGWDEGEGVAEHGNDVTGGGRMGKRCTSSRKRSKRLWRKER